LQSVLESVVKLRFALGWQAGLADNRPGNHNKCSVRGSVNPVRQLASVANNSANASSRVLGSGDLPSPDSRVKTR
jgi:hypothetical protein